MNTACRKDLKGFTLAEVLITLGIIGIVASLTLPTLITNHKKSIVETRLAKFYSTMNQAINLAEAEYGDKMNWEQLENGFYQDENGNNTTPKTTAWFNKYLRPYLNLTDAKFDGNSDSKILAYFPDGSLAMISASSILFYPQAKDYKKLESEDGTITRNKNLSGTKYFTFLFEPCNTSALNKYHYNKGVEPYMYRWDGTEEMLRNDSALGCKEDVSNERAYCTALIQMNGWKIPKDYPLRF